jgi:hypothetical protein
MVTKTFQNTNCRQRSGTCADGKGELQRTSADCRCTTPGVLPDPLDTLKLLNRAGRGISWRMAVQRRW